MTGSSSIVCFSWPRSSLSRTPARRGPETTHRSHIHRCYPWHPSMSITSISTLSPGQCIFLYRLARVFRTLRTPPLLYIPPLRILGRSCGLVTSCSKCSHSGELSIRLVDFFPVGTCSANGPSQMNFISAIISIITLST